MMKLRLSILTLVLSMGLISCTNTKPKSEDQNHESKTTHQHESVEYTINTNESVVSWKGSMIGVYAHEGDVFFKEGKLTVDHGVVTAGEFVIDMNSMVTTDDDALYKVAPREKLIAHLQSPDFFATQEYPTATFTVKSATATEITGDLKIRGKVHEEKVTDVKLTESNGLLSATGKLVFDRQKYDVSYENKMNDMVLSDDIELNIKLTASK